MKTRMMQIVWAIASCIPVGINAQNTVSGTVKTSDGTAIPNAKITLVGEYAGTYSDESGSYSIKLNSDKEITLKTTAFGYEDQEKIVKISGANTKQDFILVPSALMIEEMQVSATRASEKTPTTYTNLSNEDIKKANFGQDLPYLLETTPSTVVTSDAGAGVGYTGVRIRGVDGQRTNVTVNGIPINDAESHGTFWVNMPDLASSADNIQVQRGVGTSSNGAAAFGASINIKSDNIERNAYASLDNSIGSFMTFRNTLKVGTGLINDKFAVDVRMSRISSDGFVDRASSNLKSLFVSGAYVGDKSILKAVAFLGAEKTYQAWWGVPEWKYKGNNDSLLTHYYNNAYSGGIYQTPQDSINLFDSNPNKYNYYTYENETDNYRQDNFQLHFTHTFNPKWSLNIAGHYTKGRGYYEQYRLNDDFEDYGLTPVTNGSDTISTTDLIRRRWLDNDFYGGIFSVSYSNTKNFQLVIGGGANNYVGAHFGEIMWARFASQSEIRDRYYEDDARKTEFNGYVKANYTVKKATFFADLQARSIEYNYLGTVQYFDELLPLQQTAKFAFFNPKVGLMFDLNQRNNVYASYSISNREPVRDDFVSSSNLSQPKPENLQDLEVGYRFKSQKFLLNFNYYWMNYRDQLILTGQINDVGGYTRKNVAKSYRMGIELEAAYAILKQLSITANLNLSQNKITDFTEYVDNYDNYDLEGNMIQDVIQHSNTDIAFSPNLIAGIGLNYTPIKNLDINWYSKYVGSQFLDNTSNKNRMLDAYFISNLRISYTIKNAGFKEIVIGGMINNIFNERYANNGYTWGYVSGGNRVIENFYFPQAGRNFMLRLTLNL